MLNQEDPNPDPSFEIIIRVCKSPLSKRLANCGYGIACTAHVCREWLCVWMCHISDRARRSLSSQHFLRQLRFYGPVPEPHAAWHTGSSGRCELLPLVALRLHSALPGWFSEPTPALQGSCSAGRNSNTLLTGCCLCMQDRFWAICRKSFLRVFQFFNNDSHFFF